MNLELHGKFEQVTVYEGGQAPAEKKPERSLGLKKLDDLLNNPKFEVTGNSLNFQTQLMKVVCKSENWFKTTKALQINGGGVIVLFTTFQDGQVSDTAVYLPDCQVIEYDELGPYLAKIPKTGGTPDEAA